jgi:hypothetical protein
MRFAPLAAVAAALCATQALGLDALKQAQIEADLQAFKTSPNTFMNRHIEKKLEDGTAAPVYNLWGINAVTNKDFVTARDQGRSKFCTVHDGVPVCLGEIEPGKAPFGENDKAEDLVDNPDNMVSHLRDMDGIRKAKLAESPWSDTYWPIYMGQLGARYADNDYPSSGDWKENADYVKTNSAVAIFNHENATSLDTLSPAEKYDLLVGNMDLDFTKANWNAGKQFYDANGEVESWMGLCHGWSPAAYMLDRPTNAITVVAADGHTRLKFYPSDIKALATSLWANVRTPSRFIGGRCDTKDPKQDENGRIVDDQCFDTNPGTWHEAIVNQIGRNHRAFVMDATFDYEVWNQPVYAYDYTYFNPKTGKATDSLQAASVRLSDFSDDKFAKYRSEDAVYVVGVNMDVTYVRETQPSHRATDKAANDALNTVSYEYDVELDAHGKIVGGEWYGNEHPDFLWTPPAGYKARSNADKYATGDWDGAHGMNASWQRAGAAGGKVGQPLGKAVETLIAISRAGM